MSGGHGRNRNLTDPAESRRGGDGRNHDITDLGITDPGIRGSLAGCITISVQCTVASRNFKVFRRGIAADAVEEPFIGWCARPAKSGMAVARFPDGVWMSNIPFAQLAQKAKVRIQDCT